MSRSLKSQDPESFSVFSLQFAHNNYPTPPYTHLHPSTCILVKLKLYSVHSFRYRSQASHPLRFKDSGGKYRLSQVLLRYFLSYDLPVTGKRVREDRLIQKTVLGTFVLIFLALVQIKISVANQKMQNVCSVKLTAIATMGPTSQIISSCPDSVEL
ncbi:hypothetical protein DFH28DRAFT_885678 [Melampsora americana]|nr:hypothetical protein DFH28DRAFT_885678 [Melampsora americana]